MTAEIFSLREYQEPVAQMPEANLVDLEGVDPVLLGFIGAGAEQISHTQHGQQPAEVAETQPQATQEPQPFSLNPNLVKLFLNARGNETQAKAVAGLVVGEAVARHMVANPERYQKVAAEWQMWHEQQQYFMDEQARRERAKDKKKRRKNRWQQHTDASLDSDSPDLAA